MVKVIQFPPLYSTLPHIVKNFLPAGIIAIDENYFAIDDIFVRRTLSNLDNNKDLFYCFLMTYKQQPVNESITSQFSIEENFEKAINEFGHKSGIGEKSG